jgi:hypothetical protein
MKWVEAALAGAGVRPVVTVPVRTEPAAYMCCTVWLGTYKAGLHGSTAAIWVNVVL